MTTIADRRWFAIIWRERGRVVGGHALDYTPAEKAAYEKVHGDNIIGDFATQAEATAAVHKRLKAADKKTRRR